MNWLCWHVGTVTDPKFTVVARLSKQPRPLVLCVWAALLEHARQNDGDVSCVDYDALGVLFDTDGENVGAIYLIMEERGLIDAGKIANWNKRQHANSTERVKRFRERKRVTETDETVSSFHDVTETHETGQTDRQTDRQSREARATRLPDDWQPSGELVAWFRANRPDLNLAATTESFRNHWHAEGGQRARKHRWDLAFKEWAKRERARPPPPAAPRYAASQPG